MAWGGIEPPTQGFSMPSACRLKSLHVRNILINQYVAAQLYAKLCNVLQPATCTTQRQLYKLLHKSGRHRYPHPRACTDVLVRHPSRHCAPSGGALPARRTRQPLGAGLLGSGKARSLRPRPFHHSSHPAPIPALSSALGAGDVPSEPPSRHPSEPTQCTHVMRRCIGPGSAQAQSREATDCSPRGCSTSKMTQVMQKSHF